MAFLYINNKLEEKEISKTTVPKIVSQNNKYPGINLTRKVKNIYNEN